MNQPSSGDDDDMERRFQHGLKEDGGPSEAVRRAILEHASRMAVQHARSQAERRTPVMRAARRWSTIFGTLAAAVFAGLLVVPILRAPVVRQQSQIATPQTLAPPQPSPQAAAQAPAPAPRLGEVEQNETTDSGARAQQQIAAADAKPKEVAAPTSTASDHSSRAKAGISTIARAAPPAAPPAPLAAAPAARDAASAVAAAPATANRNSARGAASLREPGESLRGAAAAGDLAAVNALLASSSDVDARDRSGRTALMLAILNGHAVVVDALLAHGADGNAVDATGVRPLQMARTRGNEQIIDSLLRAGAR